MVTSLQKGRQKGERNQLEAQSLNYRDGRGLDHVFHEESKSSRKAQVWFGEEWAKG